MGALYALAGVSGAAALIYQVVWARMLALTFGSTTLSVAAVVAGFMGGMGLGAWLAHRAIARVRSPLACFAALELGIALSAAALSALFPQLPEAFASLAAHFEGGALDALRVVSVLVLLVLPAALMGATYPALCAVMIRSRPGVDRHLGALYGINTIGGAAGALLAGLVLVERLGLGATATCANALNLGVAFAALAFGRSTAGRPFAAAPGADTGDTALASDLPRAWIGACLLLSGFTTLSYEMYWVRVFQYVMGNSTYALTITLVVFLIGLGFGGLGLRRVVARGRPERDLAAVQVAIAVAALAGVAGVAFVLESESLRGLTLYSQQGIARSWGTRLALQALIAVLAMLPATLLMGLAFPLATRLFLGDVRALSRRVGQSVLLANAGSIAGALVGGIVLLPALGSIGATKLSALLNLGLGVGLWLACGRGALPRAGAAVVAVGVGAALVGLPPSPVFRGEVEQLDLDFSELVFQEEADLATVQVFQVPGDPTRRSMTIDGTSIAQSAGFRGERVWRKQVLLAHLPLVLDSRIESALAIGLGGGSTLAALAAHPRLERLDCVEINPAVLRASRFFEESQVLEDPRVTMIVEDALHYLLRRDGRAPYDLIVSDGKQHPFFAGNAVLHSLEFYEYALRNLGEGGLFVQWLPTATLHADLRIHLRTLGRVFPHFGVYFFPPGSLVVMGSRQPIGGRPQLSPDDFRASAAFRDLEIFGVDSPAALLSAWTANGAQVRRWLGDGPVSRWDQLILDFTPFKAGASEWAGAARDNLGALVAAEALDVAGDADGPELGDSPYAKSAPLMRRAVVALRSEHYERALALAEAAQRANPADPSARQALDFVRRTIQQRIP